MTYSDLIQFFILFLSGSAIFLVNLPNVKWARWSFLPGMSSQPFWFYDSYQHQQWGIFLLSVWFLISWGMGFYTHWIKGTGLWAEAKDLFWFVLFGYAPVKPVRPRTTLADITDTNDAVKKMIRDEPERRSRWAKHLPSTPSPSSGKQNVP